MGGGKYLSAGGRGGRRRRDRGSTKFEDFGAGWNAVRKSTQFYQDNSNSNSWLNNKGQGPEPDGLNVDEYQAIRAYTGEGHNSYHTINKALYTQKYEDMNPETQKAVDNIVSGLSKFRLEKGIQVTRQCDFKIFGAKSGQSMSIQQIKDFINANKGKDGTLENKGVLSFGSNNHGSAIDGSGLVIHAKVPASIGAGAYVNPLSIYAGSENEWLFNSHSRFKFDLSSLHKGKDGKIHINAVWKGRGRHK